MPRAIEDMPQVVSDTLTHLRGGYDFVGNEVAHAITLLDCGQPDAVRAVLVEALRVMARELKVH